MAFENQDEEDKREAERRRAEWEEVESSALGMERMPEGKKRSVGGSTVGGVSVLSFLSRHIHSGIDVPVRTDSLTVPFSLKRQRLLQSAEGRLISSLRWMGR